MFGASLSVEENADQLQTVVNVSHVQIVPTILVIQEDLDKIKGKLDQKYTVQMNDQWKLIQLDVRDQDDKNNFEYHIN